MLTQLAPSFNVVTPMGKAIAILLQTDEWDVAYWGCVQKETGEVWWWRNELIRFDTSITGEWIKTSLIKMKPAVREAIDHVRKLIDSDAYA
jgi:hypothetical protein